MKVNLSLEKDVIVGYTVIPLDEKQPIYEFDEDQMRFLEQNVGKIDVNLNIVQSIVDKENAQKRIEELKKWFDTEYTICEQKYRRLDWFYHNGTINEETTNAHNNLVELYHQAEEYRKEINELEGGIK